MSSTTPNTGFSLKLKLLALLAVILLLAIFFALPSQKSATNTITENIKFGIIDTVGITKLVLGENIITRNPNASNEWIMNGDFVVDEEMIASLWAIIQRLEVKKPASESIKEEVINSFLANGITVEAYKGEKQVRKYSVATHQGESYAMQDESSSPYSIYIPGYYLKIRDVFDIRPYEWQDRTLLSTSPNTFRSLSVEYPTNKEESFTLVFTGKNFSIQGNPTADTTKIYNYLPYFSTVMGEQFIKNQNLEDSLKSVEPVALFTMDDIRSEKPQKIAFYTARNRYYVLKENQLLLFSPQLANFLLKTKSDFDTEK